MLEVMLMALMRIGEFAKEIGVSVQRLRDLDKNGTLKPAKGYSFEVVSDVGSGINYKKKGLQS